MLGQAIRTFGSRPYGMVNDAFSLDQIEGSQFGVNPDMMPDRIVAGLQERERQRRLAAQQAGQGLQGNMLDNLKALGAWR